VLHRDRVQCSVINTPNQPVAGVSLEILMDTTALKMVDELGLLEDQIDALQEQAEDLKNKIKLLGAGTYRGSMYVTTVKLTPEKKSVAWAKVAQELEAPADLVTKYTTVSYNLLAAQTEPLEN